MGPLLSMLGIPLIKPIHTTRDRIVQLQASCRSEVAWDMQQPTPLDSASIRFLVDTSVIPCILFHVKRVNPVGGNRKLFIGAMLALGMIQMTRGNGAAGAAEASDQWFRDAVWYQIFPERFCNGDPTNDPTPESCLGTWPDYVPEGWSVIPWTSDWYARQPWEIRTGEDFYHTAQLRRYGGDLQGIIQRLDYLQDLGINAIYLNPIFDSPSLHKYGARYFHHVDRHFGPDPDGDARIIASEDPADPGTWQWTSADKLFLQLIHEVHQRKMRIIIDGVFNHVGIPFWALDRARKEGPESRFADWFQITRWDDPETNEDEFDYEGWFGIKDLPVFRKPRGGMPEPVKLHIQAVLSRWMDPDQDGNPADGVDGWRLDVAEHRPLVFWRQFRKWVKKLNPAAYLTGEVWWEDYSQHKMMNAAPWLKGDVFDSVMNYRFGDHALRFFASGEITASILVGEFNQLHHEYGFRTILNIQNILGSHDTARLASMVVNPQFRIDHGADLKSNPSYKVRKPNASERQTIRLIAAFQFLSPGAPYIYYGDELGMWGADDPDCRKPMIWPDMNFEMESAHPFGRRRAVNKVEADSSLHDFFKSLIAVRHNHKALRHGSLEWIRIPDNPHVIGFIRATGEEKILCLFNAGASPLVAELKAPLHGATSIIPLFPGPQSPSDAMNPRSFQAWLLQ